MPIIRHEMQVHNQLDTLHVLSRSEQRKKMPVKEVEGSLIFLLIETVLFLGLSIGGGFLLRYSLMQNTPGQMFLSVIMLFSAIFILFWLIPNFHAWQKKRTKR